MKEQGKDFNQLLAKLEDKEEWEVNIYADLKRMRDCISKTNPEKKEEELIENELIKKVNEYKQKSFGWMRKQAEYAKLNEILPQELNQKKKDIVLYSVYLISKEKRENFIRVIRFLNGEYKSKGLEFECIGPKLPYSFLWVK